MVSAQALFSGFTVQFEGAPQLRGDALLLRAEHLARDPEWQTCQITLLGGSAPITLATRHRASRGGSRGLLSEALFGMVDVRQLRTWLAASEPRIAVCEADRSLEGAKLRGLRELVEVFARRARAAGTFPEVEAPVQPMIAEPAPSPLPDPSAVEAAAAQPASPALEGPSPTP
jgi:hypothetical protein